MPKRNQLTCSLCQHIGTPECHFAGKIPKITPTDDEAYNCPNFYPKIKQDKTKDESVTSPGFKTEGCIFEQTDQSYVVKYSDKPFEIVETIDLKDKLYKPMEKTPWPLVSTPIKSDFETLYQETRTFLPEHIDFIDDRQYDIATCWVIATWRQEDHHTAPGLFFLGPKESGKSRALEVLESLCYRGIETANITPAGLYRTTELWKPTLLVDECEVITKNPELKSLLNTRYRKTCSVIRMEKDSKDSYTPKPYDVFGFTGLAGTNGLHDTTESRFIKINMEKTTRKLKPFKPDSEKAKELRSKLLYYRLENLGKPLPEIDMSDFTNDRLAELFQPLMTVAPEEKHSLLREYAADITRERAEEEESGTESLILHAVIENIDKIENGQLATKEITDTLNMEIDNPREKWKSITVGMILRRLGFKSARMSNNKRGIKLNQQHLTRLMKRYNITTQATLDTLLPIPSEVDIVDKGDKIHLENQIQTVNHVNLVNLREHKPTEEST